MSSKEQKAKLNKVMEVGKSLDKKFDKEGSFQQMGKKVGKHVPSIATGFPTVDNYLLGCGGMPRGRIIEIFGEESSGKTSFVCHVIGQCQKAGGVAAFVDAEHALDPTFASKLGVDMDTLVISQPDYGEEALEIVDALVDDGNVDLIVVDSVSALVPKAELEGEMGDSHMGLQARMMSQAMRKLVGKIAKKSVTVIFINQIREAVGLVFGDPTRTSGGKALKFAASVRLQVRKVSKSNKGILTDPADEKKIIGHKMNIAVKKNKVGAPYREGQVTQMYDTGYDVRDDVITHGLSIGVLEGNAWVTFKGDPKGEKFRKDDLDENRVRAAITKYYSELTFTPSIMENDNEEDQ
jgi:recombination protein RecA